MTSRRLERALWAGAALAASAAVMGWFSEPPRTAEHGFAIGVAPLPALFDPDLLAAAADDAAAANLFRQDRGMTADMADEAPVAGVASRPPNPRPPFVLRGVIGGPPWDVVIDGVPGRSAGTVIRDGQTVAGFSVRVASRDTVVVSGPDTTWTLVLRR